MLTLGIRYLTGCVVASNASDRDHVEWPPHPGRVFMALAAAHFETGQRPDERAVLEWLEQRGAPLIAASAYVERPVVTQYVPVNDKAGPAPAPIQSAPWITRKRQPRSFARAWLADDTVYLVWPEAKAEDRFAALEGLCEKVTRIGHSISLVQMWASQQLPDRSPDWIPDELQATERFRTAAPGLLQYLERQFNSKTIERFWELQAIAENDSDKKRQRAAKKVLKEQFPDEPVRLRPQLSISCGYVPARNESEPVAAGTVFDPHLLVSGLHRVDSPYLHLDLAATLQITGRLREALLEHIGTAIPEVLSGHSGPAPAERPHIAFLPLPFVEHEHADGGIRGIAVGVPRDIQVPDRQRLLAALAGIRRQGLKLGALGCWELQPPYAGSSLATLRDRVWTAFPEGARVWATVTPYVYDRHPKAKDKATYQRELAEAVRESWHRVCQSPEVAVEVIITPVSAHLGAPASHEFPRLVRKDGTQCRHTHAILIFDKPVVGPILLGAGRYRGYGLCRPLKVLVKSVDESKIEVIAADPKEEQ